jgi:ATP-binding cassette subfamily B protein
MHFYKFEAKRDDGPPPQTFGAFLNYVRRKNPYLWVVMAITDIIHYGRIPIAMLLFGYVIDQLQAAQPGQGIPHEVQVRLGVICFVLIFGELMHVWMGMMFTYWRPRLRSAIRSDFLNYTMGHSHNYFLGNFAGSLTRKVSELAEAAIRTHDILRNQIGLALLQMLITLLILLSIKPAMSLIMVAFIASIILPVMLRMKTIRSRSLAYSNQRAHMTGLIVDIFSNISAVKSFSADSHENQQHQDQSKIEINLAVKSVRTSLQLEYLRRISIVSLSCGMAILVCYGWDQGWLTVGEASVVASLSFVMAGATWGLGIGIVQFADEIGNITDSLQTLTGSHDIPVKASARPLTISKAHIQYKDVSFGYGNNSVFRNLNLDIKGGEKIALIGPSGGGKTTFVSLLMRHYDLQSGAIMIDGQDISETIPNSLRDSIAVIPQDTALFHRTLLENIRYGRRDASEEDVIAAAKKAHAHAFISGLPDGYNTMVGERGVKLSGGQRQRIAIARAILKDAPILILDEATSALDSESEQLIQLALADVMEGKTVISIAHRLSTIARMDRIIVLEAGQIIEQGTHAALLKNNGLYARLWAMQSGGFLAENPDISSH